MAIVNLKRQSNEELAARFSYLTDEELVDKAFQVGREMNFERYLLPHEREELQGLQAALRARLRNSSKPRHHTSTGRRAALLARLVIGFAAYW